MIEYPYTIKGIIDRFEENTAVIRSEGKDIYWSRSKLPQDLKEGSVVYLRLFSQEEETKERENLAKTLLNEIIKEK